MPHVSTPKTALFVGSFDPFTLGHWDLAQRALGLFDRLVIGIGVHPTKQGFLPIDVRLHQIQTLFKNDPRVEVCTYQCLTTQLAQQYGSQHIVRGLRSSVDFEYERNIASVNAEIGGLETVYLQTQNRLQHISSSMVRELASHGADIRPYLPEGMPWGSESDIKQQ